MKCPHCDSELLPGARFCDACGMPVQDSAAAPASQPFTPPPPPVIPEAYVPYPAPIISDQVSASSAQDATIPQPPTEASGPMTFAGPAPDVEPEPEPAAPVFAPMPAASPMPEPEAPLTPEPISFPGPAAAEQPQPSPASSTPPPVSHSQTIGYGPTFSTVADPSGTVLGMAPAQAGVVTLVLGIAGLALSCVGCGGIIGLAGVILGILGLNKVPGNNAKIGLVLSGLSIIVALVVVCAGGFLVSLGGSTSSGGY